MKMLITFFLFLFHLFSDAQQRLYTIRKDKCFIDINSSSKQKESFVLSCGSGCAMTYTADHITGKFPEIKVKFQVEMYMDEQLSDTYNEIYVFSYDHLKRIKNIHLKGKNDNVLNTQLPNAQTAFRDFAYRLIKRKNR